MTKKWLFFLPLLFIMHISFMKGPMVHSDMIHSHNWHTEQKQMYYDWRQAYFKENGTEQAFINTSDTPLFHRTVSEAQGYGMYLVALAGEQGLLNTQEDFRKLYYYYLDNRHEQLQLMAWRQDNIGTNEFYNWPNNATDGDLYIAYSLLLAARLWPAYADEYNQQASAILQDIKQYNYNPTEGILTVGNWVTPGSDMWSMMRASDTIPLFFQTFYQFTQDEMWLRVEQNMMSALQQISQSYTSGLVSDFIIVQNGQAIRPDGHVLENVTDRMYSWNACRVPFQLAYTYQQAGSYTTLQPMLQFFSEQEHIYSTYELDGTPTALYTSKPFSGTLGYVARMDPQYQHMRTNMYWFEHVPIDGTNYYGDTLFLMANISLT